MQTSLKHLFKPGAGAIPPHLAGRLAEQEYFQDCVDLMLKGEPTNQDMVVYGPRGNGKTVLLRYLQNRMLKQHADKLDMLWETPGQLRNPAQLFDQLSGSDKSLRNRVRKMAVSLNLGFLDTSTEIDLTRWAITINDLLREISRKKPFILIIDEAHRLNPEMGEVILNASQAVRGEELPFLLVLAGTPNLEAALRKAHASFWDRNKKFPVGRLSIEESMDAISVPLAECAVTLAPEVVREVAGRAHCYPYFLQVWGNHIAIRLEQTGEREVTMETLTEVESKVADECNQMYMIRRDELIEMDLLPVAEAVAQEFISNSEGDMSEARVRNVIEKTLPDDGSVSADVVMGTIGTLSQVGYIWQVIDADGSVLYEPGIPSFMSFVLRNRG